MSEQEERELRDEIFLEEMKALESEILSKKRNMKLINPSFETY